jgi:transcriptional regulator with XRE-family HTH domain
MRYVNISECIINIRKNYGLTQKELGDELGVTSQAVSKWERGENFPDTDMLVIISEKYDISIDDLLRGKQNSVTTSKSLLKETRFLIAAVLLMFSGGYFYYQGIGSIVNIVVVTVPLVLGSIIIFMTIKQRDLNRTSIDKVSKGVYTLAFIVFLVFGLYYGIFYISWLAFPLAYAILMIAQNIGKQ